jgi:prolyl 4-hydroxylase
MNPEDYAIIDSISPAFATRIHCDAHLYYVDDFLTEQECDFLIDKIKQRSNKSTVTTYAEPNLKIRSSSTSHFYRDKDPFINAIDKKICNYLGFEQQRAEEIQGQHYLPGEQFTAHTDYFTPNSEEYAKYASKEGQRTWTFMVYLNDVEEGGTTDFVKLGYSFKPKRGRAVFWNNLFPDGSPNPYTEHWAKPVITGEKFIITKWFRALGQLSTPFRQQVKYTIPTFTRQGFSKVRIPFSLYAEIKAWYDANVTHQMPEVSDAINVFVLASDAGKTPATMLFVPDPLKLKINNTLHPVLEMWANTRLEMTALYGVREYKRGATLLPHTDRPQTHQVSAILNIAQSVETPWPLLIHDHLCNTHDIYLEPGEMLLYESARLIHGRPYPLEGDYFANIFVHAAAV